MWNRHQIGEVVLANRVHRSYYTDVFNKYGCVVVIVKACDEKNNTRDKCP